LLSAWRKRLCLNWSSSFWGWNSSFWLLNLLWSWSLWGLLSVLLDWSFWLHAIELGAGLSLELLLTNSAVFLDLAPVVSVKTVQSVGESDGCSGDNITN